MRAFSKKSLTCCDLLKFFCLVSRRLLFSSTISPVAALLCGQVNTGEDKPSPVTIQSLERRTWLSWETGCSGLVLQQAAIALKHDSAFNGYCSHSSHLALVGEECLGEVASSFTGAPVLRDILPVWPEMNIHSLIQIHSHTFTCSLTHLYLTEKKGAHTFTNHTLL